MYTHTIKVEMPDDLVHRYSILEWEAMLSRNSVVQADELPLSYGRIAELLAEEYHKYGAIYFGHEYGDVLPKESTETLYTNKLGYSVNTRLQPAAIVAAHDDAEVSTLSAGVAGYGRRRKSWGAD